MILFVYMKNKPVYFFLAFVIYWTTYKIILMSVYLVTF